MQTMQVPGNHLVLERMPTWPTPAMATLFHNSKSRGLKKPNCRTCVLYCILCPKRSKTRKGKKSTMMDDVFLSAAETPAQAVETHASKRHGNTTMEMKRAETPAQAVETDARHRNTTTIQHERQEDQQREDANEVEDANRSIATMLIDQRHGDLRTKPDPTIAANARRHNQSTKDDKAEDDTMMRARQEEPSNVYDAMMMIALQARRHNQSTCQMLSEINETLKKILASWVRMLRMLEERNNTMERITSILRRRRMTTMTKPRPHDTAKTDKNNPPFL